MVNILDFEYLFKKIAALKVVVLGDFALDFYYSLQKPGTEKSIETGLEVYYGNKPRSLPGAAGNVAANVAALGVQHIYALGLVAADIYGRELCYQLEKSGIGTENLCFVENWDTACYTKPMQQGSEQNRIDFGTANNGAVHIPLLLSKMQKILPDIDLLLLNQQFSNPLLDESSIEKVLALGSNYPDCLHFADFRHKGLAASNTSLKVNVKELARLLQISAIEEHDSKQCEYYAALLSEKTNSKILLSRGAYGLQYFDGKDHYYAPAVPIAGPIDTVGAGDTAFAAFSLALRASNDIDLSLKFANLAAAVSIQKIAQTGTASPHEVLAMISQTKSQLP